METSKIAGYPLSPQQKANFTSGGVYHRCFAAVPGRPDPERLETALVALVRKYEILRTYFEKIPGMEFPVQMIEEDPAHIPLMPVVDTRFRDLAAIRSFLAEDQLNDLWADEGCGWRFRLFQTDVNGMVLLLEISSLLADATAAGMIVDELCKQYESPDEANVEIQYADLSGWLNEILEEKNDYWQKRALFAEKSLYKKEHTACVVSLHLPIHVAKRLDNNFINCGKDLLLFTVWQSLLCRLDPDEKWCFFYSTGRNLPELQHALGALEKKIPVITQGLEASLVNTVLKVHENLTEDQQWEHDIPEYLEKQAVHFPGFRYVANNNSNSWPIIGQSINELSDRPVISVFKLAEGFEIQLSSALSATAANRLLDRYMIMLDNALRFPDQQLKNIKITTGQEEQMLLRLGSGAIATVTAETPQSLHGLFELQASNNPQGIALKCKNRQLTYGQLNEAANRLSHLISSDESYVGIYCERGVEMVIAMLAVLKAGAAYVPLDPSYPEGRLSYIAEHSRLKTILVSSEINTLSWLPHRVKTMPIATDELSGAKAPVKRIINPALAAYVLYTSGSTGQPKGVVVEHRQLVNHMIWMQKEYQFNKHDIFLQRTPFGFDASVWEIFSPLIAGSTLVLMPAEDQQNLQAIVGHIIQEKITVLQAVPSLLSGLLQAAGGVSFSSLRYMFCGGEPLPLNLRKAFVHNHQAKLINLYGPTECTIQVSHFDCTKDVGTDTVPIGKPIHGVRLYVLNESLQLQPAGVKGELYISGAAVSRGYLYQPVLTASSFVPDPFASDSGAIMYKTGDLAAWTQDGNLELFGRIDQQVKLRGFRIELGEIEEVIGKHVALSKVITVINGTDELQQLCCFYTANNSVNEQELRQLASSRLPAYMVPSVFIQLTKIPRTVNGKADRKALAMMDLNRLGAERAIVPPADHVESELLEIWKNLLKRDRISVTDNFFEAGGHSLLAVNLASAIHDKLGRDFRLSEVFEAPTIKMQALLIQRNSAPAFSSMVCLAKGDALLTPVFFIHPTGGFVFCYTKLATMLGRPVYALQDPGLSGKRSAYHTIEELALIYAEDIKKVQAEGPYILGGWSFGGVVALEIARLLHGEGAEIARLFCFDSYAPLDKKPQPNDGQLMVSIAKLLADMNGTTLCRHVEELIARNENNSSFSMLLKLAIDVKLLAANATEKDVETLVDVFRANVYAMNEYQCKAHPFEMHLFEPKEGVPENLSDAAFRRAGATAANNWQECGAVTVHPAEGHHLNMLSETHIHTIAAQLNNLLNAADRE
ncbi:non-ribosomal peptide synthetase [Mucilaginibacter phyllosphaerae]|uniref:Amino acid adenylation domain-containing protein n=1 Tax=Mucilaginibacter phyllosphaerae TaxID=1812349 RepID=A0A4Y8AFW5_9SPHI|nr:non-ribosomal peptide synthetase [Mucilaginibacter phyllosphaerae]MBB3968721.1 amino acid adenylation domain-containing protein [Mucilaginibacter phyllosphaerae]TEW67643.1 non-ribosomal peptide synthetase [Mucilaginibacter phyllosphaerae]GGH14292.1 hypothetical protein GCM10007352_22290 [Mucilaginibacter phyllosphaerae]